ncbi:LOB domain-containing protein 37-like [Cornus florida]|uniref:LOB domain-containing protein 37-like n=1 Tax=Cornus florida TaxID=4283 RepID=UPI00289F14F6|nr:LOB domain-containing protein 37-like [Cornus florida]
MSCNGCRVLRKGCSETCILRPCLQWIETPEAQGHATVFVAKFFGRAGLMSFISAVPEHRRPALFQSLLFEACGRTVNPVNGAVGLLWTGNWHVCQAAVETVLRGGVLRPIPELLGGGGGGGGSFPSESGDNAYSDAFKLQDLTPTSRSKAPKRRRSDDVSNLQFSDLDLSLTAGFPAKLLTEKTRPGTPSMNSEESVTTTACLDSGLADQGGEPKLLSFF